MDKYKELREAAEKATPGPWVSDYKEGETDPDCPDVTIWSGPAFKGQFVSNICFDNCPANGRYIAAANPATIQALLAERDALRAALSELVECKRIKERIAIEQATLIAETDDEFAELDRLMSDYAQRQPKAWEAARAALSL